MSIRSLLIRCLLPTSWRSRKRAAAGLEEFSVTEIDSAWQSLRAMDSTPDPALRAKLFTHAVEESRHGELFAAAAKEFSDLPPSLQFGERLSLLDPALGPEGLVAFYAYESVGESEISREFETYEAAVPYAEVKAIFHSLLVDERGHALYTARTLKELAPSAGQRKLALLKARWRRFYEAWLRFSKGIGEFPSALVLGAIYFMIGPMMRGACRKGLEQPAPPSEAGA